MFLKNGKKSKQYGVVYYYIQDANITNPLFMITNDQLNITQNTANMQCSKTGGNAQLWLFGTVFIMKRCNIMFFYVLNITV